MEIALELKWWFIYSDRQWRKITILCDKYCGFKNTSALGDRKDTIWLWNPRRLLEGKNKRVASWRIRWSGRSRDKGWVGTGSMMFQGWREQRWSKHPWGRSWNPRTRLSMAWYPLALLQLLLLRAPSTAPATTWDELKPAESIFKELSEDRDSCQFLLNPRLLE